MKILKRNQIIISVIALMLITVGYMNYASNINASLETGALLDTEEMAGIGDARLVNSNDVSGNIQENADVSGQEKVQEGNKNNSNTKENNEKNTKENNENNTAESSAQLVDNFDEDVDKNTQGNQISSGASSISTTTQATSSTSYANEYFASSRLERDKMYSQMLETYQGVLQSDTISTEQKNISTQEITKINNKKNSIMIAENLIKNLGFEDVVIFVNDSSTSVIVKAEKLTEADIAQIQNIVCREIGVKAEMIHISLK